MFYILLFYRIFCMLATDLLSDGEEAADGEGAVGVGLAPDLGTLAKLGVVIYNEEGDQQIDFQLH